MIFLMKQSAIMFLFFFLNTAFLCAMDIINPDDNGAVAHLAKRLGSLNIVSSESRQTRYEQVKSCEELSKKIDGLIKNDRALSSLKGMTEKKSFIAEKKAIDALMYIHPAIPTTIDGLSQEDIFDILHQKNKFFRSLVDQLVYQKSIQLEAVVGSTIDTALSTKGSFSLLPFAMKKYLLAQTEKCFFRKNLVLSEYLFRGHTDLVLSIDCHPKNQQLVSGSADKTVRFWNVRTGNCEHIHTCAAPVTSLDHRLDGAQIAIATDTPEVILLDSQTHAVTQTLIYPEPIAAVSWSDPSLIGGTQWHLIAASNITKSLYLRDMAISSFPIISVFQLNLGNGGLYDGFKSIGNNNLFRVIGNDICLREENRILSLCMKARENSLEDVEELRKLYASQLVEIMPEIYKNQFKSDVKARIAELKNK